MTPEEQAEQELQKAVLRDEIARLRRKLQAVTDVSDSYSRIISEKEDRITELESAVEDAVAVGAKWEKQTDDVVADMQAIRKERDEALVEIGKLQDSNNMLHDTIREDREARRNNTMRIDVFEPETYNGALRLPKGMKFRP